MTVPRIFPNSTIVCIATGPSLVPEDVDACRGAARVIAINDAGRLAPWADVWYACDRRWWHWQVRDHRPALLGFKGLKFSLQQTIVPDVVTLKNTGVTGLELDPSGLKTGRNSGYQAINLAVHLGATRILLLGYDMSPGPRGVSHYFGEHPDGQKPPFTVFRRYFRSISAPLKAAGVEVLNCSRRSALTCFPKVTLDRALSMRRAA